MSESKRYRSVKEVVAEPMIQHDFIMTQEVPAGGPPIRDGYGKGYRITDANGRQSWMVKEQFEREFREIK